ncbi:MAG TPA: Asp-tRNA(Asn)/Glu-tRNA(Gln) amidotransferase subunit GatB [Gemmatimonadota bacterium]|nr:Asp-tRNA(Asn)/Glu-tRNA(Gln) amidotransferase subunit GatB [Gemmatimonadota bacterium]
MEGALERWEPVIGLEVHVQLATKSKIFCGCATRYGEPPNTQVCPVCLGYPGTLPVLNERAVELAVVAALALGCEVQPTSIFARKHYFYPDLPKGYQISQYDRPLATAGGLEIVLDDGTRKAIGITRLHLEEDAGKSLHGSDGTRVDFNRCGTPLIEIVSEPDLASPREAYLYLSTLKRSLQYLDVSDCNMEEGSLRCDANVSLRPRGEGALGTKTEVKNVNSFRYVEDALTYEILRQAEALDAGRAVVHETLLWDSARGEARPMRSKEMSHDYRYFPEPDLEPLAVPAARVEEIRSRLPEGPAARAARFVNEYGLPDYDAGVLTATRGMAEYFEAVVERFGDAKEVSNWVMGEVLRLANERGEEVRLEPEPSPLSPERLAALLRLKSEGAISGSAAKEVLAAVVDTGRDPAAVVEERGLAQVSDTGALEAEIDAVLEAHPDEVAAYRAGKEGLMGFFVGQVMRRTRGKANPQRVNELLRERL